MLNEFRVKRPRKASERSHFALLMERIGGRQKEIRRQLEAGAGLHCPIFAES
jgi:hypothetical protein